MSSPASPNGTPHKSRLTNEQKKKNHIESEKKRRDAIRAGFDKLADIVPKMTGQGRSEAVVLQHTVAYMKYLLARREVLDKLAAEVRPLSPIIPQSQVESSCDLHVKVAKMIITKTKAGVKAV